MKKLLLSMLLWPVLSFSQICNPNGNIFIFSNYDGGVLNIDIDVDIPNLKIGIVSYEGVTINLTGTYLNNVTEIEYAGYNADNAHCGSIINTSINGAPGSATTNIVLTPASTLSNSNGNSSIICAYSCDNNSNQGGCNTVDQVEDYFITLFGGTLYAHHTQYGCWSGTQLLSTSGNCCPITPLNSSLSNSNANCYGICDGTASVTAGGGTAPYTYLWTPGGETTPSVDSLCPNTYTLIMTDDIGDTTMHVFTISEPTAITSTFTSTDDPGNCSGTITSNPSGGIPPYTYSWDAAGGNATTAMATGLCFGFPCVTITDSSGCNTTVCDTVLSSSSITEDELNIQTSIYPNPTDDKSILIIKSEIQQNATFIIYDAQGRIIRNEKLVLNNGTNEISVFLTTKGIYVLSVKLASGEAKLKLVVE